MFRGNTYAIYCFWYVVFFQLWFYWLKVGKSHTETNDYLA